MSDTLSSAQLRMARALLDMSRDDVEAATGIAKQTLLRIENNAVRARDETLRTLVNYFGRLGVEFLPGEGVRRKPVAVDVLAGREGLQEFFNGVHEYASKYGGTIMMFGIDETTFIETITPEFSQNYLKRMAEVSHTRGDLEVLAITCEGDTNFCASSYNEYRWISKDVFQAVPFYIYGETLAIMDFDTAPGPTIMLLKSRAITNAYRKQFQAFWKMAYTPPSMNKMGTT